MNWLIIVIVIVVIIGPVLYLVPDAKDKRLTQLRAQARKQGLSVKITSVPKLDPTPAERVTAGGKTLDPKILCSAYLLPVGQSLGGVSALCLCRLPANPTLLVQEVIPGWALVEDDNNFWPHFEAMNSLLEKLPDILRHLPEDTVALGIDERSVACYWREKSAADSGVVEVIASGLRDLRNALVLEFGTKASD